MKIKSFAIASLILGLLVASLVNAAALNERDAVRRSLAGYSPEMQKPAPISHADVLRSVMRRSIDRVQLQPKLSQRRGYLKSGTVSQQIRGYGGLAAASAAAERKTFKSKYYNQYSFESARDRFLVKRGLKLR